MAAWTNRWLKIAVLHAKADPTFVSDATSDDVLRLLSFLKEKGAVDSINFVGSTVNLVKSLQLA
jgi:hypothetical protein